MDVRYLRTEPTMAFPHGRLLAVRGGRLHLLAPKGWDVLGVRVEHARPLTREEAEDWCEREGWDLHLLDSVPVPDDHV
ncbi:hypothetical protein FHS29_003089 [Saccharothrix tamanrassetensis]|uniref:Uncharacterized protein n=1 Tax=Saccharothrix tamanrassetensis TaxID=1051531 RepID=A0A841CHP5_9PSEU|nr:hypothetical protein [Saccharothrix tamanrassetensis]MBB5956503.1 hypothetical protein [Saccharothrix tamanrassetensis]